MNNKRFLILQWCEDGVIPRDKIREALNVAKILPSSREWHLFIDRLLLWIGILSLTISVIFFFAYNWDGMGRYLKFGLIELLIFAALASSWKVGTDSPAGKALLLGLSLLLGGLLALFGQIYQTGADPWQLFAIWSLLILPWVMVGRFAALWLFWLFLVNLSLYLYFTIFPHLWGLFFSIEPMLLVTALFNTTALVLWELGAGYFSWLRERWPVRMVGVLSGVTMTTLMLQTILSWNNFSGWGCALYSLWIAGIYLGYRKVEFDLFMLAGMCLSLIFVVTAFLTRALLDYGDAGGFLLIAMAVIGMSALSAAWLKSIHGEMKT